MTFRQRVNTSSGAVDPAGHPLVASTPDFDSFCNRCRREIHDAEIRHSCTACDYDLCNVCAVNATSTAVDTEMIKGMALQAKNTKEIYRLLNMIAFVYFVNITVDNILVAIAADDSDWYAITVGVINGLAALMFFINGFTTLRCDGECI